MNILIITGGSQGIGNAIAKKYAKEHFTVYSLARKNSNIDTVIDYPVDLSNIATLENSITKLFQQINLQEATSITLINNAGTLGTISNIENIPTAAIYQTIQVNTTAAFILSSLFIKHTEDLTCKRQIINISSGAATKPYEGWSIYCSSKAALDMFTKTVAAEQIANKNGVKVIALYPGVVDTAMQTEIRATSVKKFKNVERFINLKEDKQLYTPEFVAKTIFNLIQSDTLANGTILDIRNLNKH